MKFYPSDEIKLTFSVSGSDGRWYTPFVNIGDANWTWTVHGISGTDLDIHGNNSKIHLVGKEGFINPVYASLQSATSAKINQYISDTAFDNNWVYLTDYTDELIHMTISGDSAFIQGYVAIRYLRLSVTGAASGSAYAYYFDESKI